MSSGKHGRVIAELLCIVILMLSIVFIIWTVMYGHNKADKGTDTYTVQCAIVYPIGPVPTVQFKAKGLKNEPRFLHPRSE